MDPLCAERRPDTQLSLPSTPADCDTDHADPGRARPHGPTRSGTGVRRHGQKDSDASSGSVGDPAPPRRGGLSPAGGDDAVGPAPRVRRPRSRPCRAAVRGRLRPADGRRGRRRPLDRPPGHGGVDPPAAAPTRSAPGRRPPRRWPSALAVRGPAPGTPAATVATALESASDLLLDLEADDPAAPMTTYLVAETALLSGRFVAAEEAAARGRAVATGQLGEQPARPDRAGPQRAGPGPLPRAARAPQGRRRARLAGRGPRRADVDERAGGRRSRRSRRSSPPPPTTGAQGSRPTAGPDASPPRPARA